MKNTVNELRPTKPLKMMSYDHGELNSHLPNDACRPVTTSLSLSHQTRALSTRRTHNLNPGTANEFPAVSGNTRFIVPRLRREPGGEEKQLPAKLS